MPFPDVHLYFHYSVSWVYLIQIWFRHHTKPKPNEPSLGWSWNQAKDNKIWWLVLYELCLPRKLDNYMGIQISSHLSMSIKLILFQISLPSRISYSDQKRQTRDILIHTRVETQIFSVDRCRLLQMRRLIKMVKWQ